MKFWLATSHQKHVLGMEESSNFSHQEDSYILKSTLVEKDKGSGFYYSTYSFGALYQAKWTLSYFVSRFSGLESYPLEHD